MHPSLQRLDHRPWPLPAVEWNWRQSWLDLTFIHYRVDVKKVSTLLPDGIRLQEFDGSAWVGVVPFQMAGVMRRPLPDIPGVSSCLELNLRTYVEFEGRPGVWFFSLDANSWPLVLGGRHVYGLPYFPARMTHRRSNEGWHTFSSSRRGGAMNFSARYRPFGEMFFSKPGTFEHWATERYCLYSHSRRRGIERVNVHHVPWPLQKAEVEMNRCDLLTAAGIKATDMQPVCHFSSGVHVVSYPIEKLIPAREPVV